MLVLDSSVVLIVEATQALFPQELLPAQAIPDLGAFSKSEEIGGFDL